MAHRHTHVCGCVTASGRASLVVIADFHLFCRRLRLPPRLLPFSFLLLFSVSGQSKFIDKLTKVAMPRGEYFQLLSLSFGARINYRAGKFSRPLPRAGGSAG